MKTLLTLVLLVVSTATFADVRVVITRVLPEPWNKTQHIVQEFHDDQLWQDWMIMKMNEGCDKYVTNVDIDLKWDGVTVVPKAEAAE